jgi:hypothetical protein
MYRNQRFSSSWIFEGMAFVVFSCKQRVGDELGKDSWGWAVWRSMMWFELSDLSGGVWK